MYKAGLHALLKDLPAYVLGSTVFIKTISNEANLYPRAAMGIFAEAVHIWRAIPALRRLLGVQDDRHRSRRRYQGAAKGCCPAQSVADKAQP